jgi:hypothetical protein
MKCIAPALTAAALVFGAVACGRSDVTLDIAGADGAADDSSGPAGPDGSSGEGSTEDASDGAKSGDSAAGDGAPGSCGPSNCQGCCDGTNCIWPPSSASQCGLGGVACGSCNNGGMCLKGTCVYPRPNCGPANCQGCCVDANLCTDGTAEDLCGFGGEQCEGCGPMGNLTPCVPQPGGGGSCHATCGPGVCNGCCNGATCELGQSTSACGENGSSCTVCGQGEICAVQGAGGGGICQEPCSPSTCAGCCQGEVCAVGDQDVACGTGGGACADCTAESYLCVQGTCQP